jgi:hypothetical protein
VVCLRLSLSPAVLSSHFRARMQQMTSPSSLQGSILRAQTARLLSMVALLRLLLAARPSSARAAPARQR